MPFDTEDWDRLPDRFGFDPAQQAEWRDLLAALHQAVDDKLTERHRAAFAAIVLNKVPLDLCQRASGPRWPPPNHRPSRVIGGQVTTGRPGHRPGRMPRA